MGAQQIVVAVLVAVCALHAAWRLSPAGWRAAVRGRITRRPAAQMAGCSAGCVGCRAARPDASHAPLAPDASGEQVVRLVPRQGRPVVPTPCGKR